MHIILGAGGPVANALTKQFIQANLPVRLVSRREVNFNNANVTWQKADLTRQAEVMAATRDATVIYMCAGLVYDKDVWKQQWPIIMQNIINAANSANARLMFFDNVYMYGLVDGPMLETTPYNPISEKGEVRARVAEQLMAEVAAGNLQASIARAADFYGAESMNSFFDMMVLAKYAKKEKAMWMGDVKVLHNFTYVPDAGRAMFLLGKHPESDNQIWHLPTAAPLTGTQFMELSARIFNTKPAYMTVNKFMLQLMGLFKKTIQGTVEMYYQYDYDYIFNSDKFERAFNVKPTNYEDGIKHLSLTQFKNV